MKAIMAIGCGALAASLAACSPPRPHARMPRTISALDCPQREGDLTLKSRASDGGSCLYVNDAGEVSLRLLGLNGGGAGAVLDPIEASLRAEMPGAAGAGATADAGSAPTAGAPGDKDRVDIDLPGIHIHARGDDTAKVNVGGVAIDANDKGAGHVTVNGGAAGATGAGVNVEANDRGAVVHVTEPGAGIRRTVILTSDTPGPNGYRSVGYEARGPLPGPIVVAVFKSRASDRAGIKDDLRDLIRDNVGG